MKIQTIVFFLLISISPSPSLFAQDSPTSMDSPLYRGLEKALQDYENFAAEGDWPKIPKGKKLELGGSDPKRIPLLRERLKAERLWSGSMEGDVLDEDLTRGLQKFQELNGLEADGVLGLATTQALNIKPSERVCQIRQNRDRILELNSKLESTYLLVNVPEFILHVVQGGKEVMDMKVVAGRSDRKTPLLNSQIHTIIFNPAWHVPYSIAVKDKLSKIREDPDFLANNNMHLFEKSEDGTVTEVDPNSVDWSVIDRTNFNYSIRQDPGDGNALGLIKFIFPNKDSVYLHDTSQKSLFAKALRPFSSGCIRLENPLDLAEYLLKDREGWSRERIETAMHAGHESGLRLENHMPIHIAYYTAWGTGQNSYTFRPDVYGYDKKKCE